ncbi:MAG: nucleoside triphosphate pyrophosphohydrolase [Myxococcota bacterium]
MSTELRRLVERLRAECPWDRAQDHRSMRPYLLEETYEVIDALDAGDAARLRDELGDLLFQVYFHARLAEERGEFDIQQVADAIVAKMVERHPHVFAGTDDDPSVAGWEARKAAARRGGSRFDSVPRALPALLRAHRVGEKVAHVGFDWPDLDGVLAKVDEERRELAEALAGGDRAEIEHEYGDLLLACANLGRFLGIPGEDALREANRRFEDRFRIVERLAAEAGVRLEEAGLDRLDAWWQEAKALSLKPEA